MTPPLVLVDPPRAPFWPLAATRPVADLLAGARSFHARWAASFGPLEGLWCDREVAGCAFRSGSAPAINGWPEELGDGLRVALASWVPPRGWAWGARGAWTCRGTPVAWALDGAAARSAVESGAATPAAILEWLAGHGSSAQEAGGVLPGSVWDLLDDNGLLLRQDAPEFVGRPPQAGEHVVLLGDDVAAGEGVAIEPFVVLDSRAGPIMLERGSRLEAHARCRGPLYVGSDSVILGGSVAGASIGPGCRIRGEVEDSIFQGWDNKAHEGFVGHSALGEWVNLGAGTTTSDLKNTYGAVRVRGPAGRIDTGRLKLGAMLGDHVKTGIGTLLPTGAQIGTGTHVFGGRGMAPDYLPSFAWHDGETVAAVHLEPFLRTVGTAMARRRQSLTEGEREILTALRGSADG